MFCPRCDRETSRLWAGVCNSCYVRARRAAGARRYESAPRPAPVLLADLAARVTEQRWAIDTAMEALGKAEDSYDVYRLRQSLIVALYLLRRAS